MTTLELQEQPQTAAPQEAQGTGIWQKTGSQY